MNFVFLPILYKGLLDPLFFSIGWHVSIRPFIAEQSECKL